MALGNVSIKDVTGNIPATSVSMKNHWPVIRYFPTTEIVHRGIW